MGHWDGRRYVVDQGPVDPFRRAHHNNIELGKRVIEMEDASQPPPEPSQRTEFPNVTGPRAAVLREAALNRMRLGDGHPDANRIISDALQAERADLEQAGEHELLADPLANAHLTNQMAEYADDEAATAAEQREHQEAFDQFVVQNLGGGDLRATQELLAEFEPAEYQELMDVLNEAFYAESEHQEYGDDGEAGDGGEEYGADDYGGGE